MTWNVKQAGRVRPPEFAFFLRDIHSALHIVPLPAHLHSLIQPIPRRPPFYPEHRPPRRQSNSMLALAPPIQQHTAIPYAQPSTAPAPARPSRTTSRRTSSYSFSSQPSSSSSFNVSAPTHSRSSTQGDLQPSSSGQIPSQSSFDPQPSSSRQNGSSCHGGDLAYSHTSSEDSLSAVPRSESESSQIDIHTYDSQDLLRLLASLLAQIATTNDNITGRDIHSPPGFQSYPPSGPGLPTNDAHRPPIWRTLTTASKTALSSNMSLTFHARNVPTISLEAYLLRILRYCPASNEVFLSLLVYFDRMSRLAKEACGRPFIIDSYNIHRLVIAGVTVASKFFSDVFYTNSRYAKVCVDLYLTRLCATPSNIKSISAVGRRFATGRIEPVGTPVPSAKQLLVDDFDGRDATLRGPAHSLLKA